MLYFIKQFTVTLARGAFKKSGQRHNKKLLNYLRKSKCYIRKKEIKKPNLPFRDDIYVFHCDGGLKSELLIDNRIRDLDLEGEIQQTTTIQLTHMALNKVDCYCLEPEMLYDDYEPDETSRRTSYSSCPSLV